MCFRNAGDRQSLERMAVGLPEAKRRIAELRVGGQNLPAVAAKTITDTFKGLLCLDVSKETLIETTTDWEMQERLLFLTWEVSSKSFTLVLQR